MGFKTSQEATCVLRKPVFLSGFPPTLTHKVDDIVDLSCTFDGSPRPEICWYFNQQPITSTNCTRVKFLDGNLRLRIRRLTFEDAGVYSCIVKNEAGEIEKSCTLTVERNPIVKAPEILGQPDDVTCAEGEDIVISCKSSYVAAVGCYFVWKKHGQPIDATERIRYGKEMITGDTMWVNLSISNVQKEDAGVYSLRSLNMFGGADSKEAIVNVIEASSSSYLSATQS